MRMMRGGELKSPFQNSFASGEMGFPFWAYRNIQIGSRQAVDWYSDTASLVGNVSDRLLPSCLTHSTQQGGLYLLARPQHEDDEQSCNEDKCE